MQKHRINTSTIAGLLLLPLFANCAWLATSYSVSVVYFAAINVMLQGSGHILN